MEQGGLQPGGLNFDAKVRRESTDPEDLFIAHIGAMDAFARGLRNAVCIIEEGLLAAMVKVRLILVPHAAGTLLAPPEAAREFGLAASHGPFCRSLGVQCHTFFLKTGAILKLQPRHWSESGGWIRHFGGNGGVPSSTLPNFGL